VPDFIASRNFAASNLGRTIREKKEERERERERERGGGREGGREGRCSTAGDATRREIALNGHGVRRAPYESDLYNTARGKRHPAAEIPSHVATG